MQSLFRWLAIPKENSKIANNYIEIDLKDQKCIVSLMAKIVTTDVITGRYNKGTATVPGFHTILYRTTDVNLEGQMLMVLDTVCQ